MDEYKELEKVISKFSPEEKEIYDKAKELLAGGELTLTMTYGQVLLLLEMLQEHAVNEKVIHVFGRPSPVLTALAILMPREAWAEMNDKHKELADQLAPMQAQLQEAMNVFKSKTRPVPKGDQRKDVDPDGEQGSVRDGTGDPGESDSVGPSFYQGGGSAGGP